VRKRRTPMAAGRGRRRRRRRSGRAEGAPREAPQAPKASPPEGDGSASRKRSRRRRKGGRRTAGEPRPASPLTLDDVISSIRGTPDRLTAPPDGQRLEEVIGELQSIWGVPQYPQEYRLTIKVAEEGTRAAAPANGVTKGPNGVTRERAPAAPRVAAGSSETAGRSKTTRRRRRARRGRRNRGTETS
jgi:hypothetical protein